MIRKIQSLVVSEAVLNALVNHDDAESVQCYVECYQNGREQGFLLFGFSPVGRGKAVYFAQHRNSDDIVVYVGEYAMQSISDDAYRHQNFFSTVDSAVEFIMEQAKLYCKEDKDAD